MPGLETVTAERLPIAVNVMGGDETDDHLNDKNELVEGIGYSAAALGGAVDAAARGIRVVLIGNQEVLPDTKGLEVIHTPDYIGMEDHEFAARASADKRTGNLSIVRAVRGHKDGEFAAVVCGGSTGGAMAAAALILGRTTGIHRPAISTLLPHLSPEGVVSYKAITDSGANPHTTLRQYVDNTVIGMAYASEVMGINEPRLGLLVNGTEEGKGPEKEQQVYAFLKEHSERMGVNFIGNIEGSDVFDSTRVDVVLTDGNIGNIVIKVAGGLGAMIKKFVMARAGTLNTEQLHAFNVLYPVMFEPLIEAISKNKIGGSQLGGVNGDVIIAHGSSSREGFMNAIIRADELANSGLRMAVSAGVKRIRDDEGVHAAYKALSPQAV